MNTFIRENGLYGSAASDFAFLRSVYTTEYALKRTLVVRAAEIYDSNAAAMSFITIIYCI